MSRTLFGRTLLILAGVAAATSASAGTITTWTGTGANTNWTTAGNWSSSVNNSGTFSLVFTGSAAPANASNNNVTPGVNVDSLSFNSTGSKTYRIAGSGSVRLTNGSTVTSSAASVVISDTISAPVALLGTSTFNLGTNHNLLISGAVSGGSITKTGAGDLFLNGATSLTPSTGLTVNQGFVVTNTNSFSALNNQTVALGNGGTVGGLKINGVTGTTAAAFRFAGNANISPVSNSNVTFSAPTFNQATSGTAPITLTLAGGGAGQSGTETIQGIIQDNSATGKVSVVVGQNNNFNVWVFSGANTYTGDTTVASVGRFLNNGVVASPTTSSSGFLGGSGTFSGAVNILSGTLSPGGTSSSGNLSDSIGKLTLGGALTLSSPATTVMTVTGTDSSLYDSIAGVGSLNYGGTLALTLSGSYADHTNFNLFTGFTANPSTHLNGLTLSATGSPYEGLVWGGSPVDGGDWYTGWNAYNQRLKFSESTGTLTVVPEPSTIVFAGIGMAMFGWSTWTRRRSKARRQAIEGALA